MNTPESRAPARFQPHSPRVELCANCHSLPYIDGVSQLVFCGGCGQVHRGGPLDVGGWNAAQREQWRRRRERRIDGVWLAAALVLVIVAILSWRGGA